MLVIFDGLISVMSQMLVGLNNLKLLRSCGQYASYCGDIQNVYNIPIPKIAFYSQDKMW